MSVSIFSDGNRYYWRVYRKWGNAPPHQHYIPFGEDRFASMEKAVDLDLQLQERQRAYHISLLYRADHWIRPDGKLRGVYVGVDGRGRPGFKCDVRIPWETQRLRRSRSIISRSPLDAYRSIINVLGREVGFDPWSDLAKELRQCYPAYASDIYRALVVAA